MTECINFTHTLTCESKHLQQAAYLVLHTICFHRCLGTIRPASIDSFETSFVRQDRLSFSFDASVSPLTFSILCFFLPFSSKPAVADIETDTLLRAHSAQLASLFSSSPNVNQVELVLSFFSPSKPSQKSPAQEPNPIPAAGGRERANSVVNTAALAASSLKAWASPKAYQYGWLAQAFSGGAGQPGHAFLTTPGSDRNTGEEAKEDRAPFETWTVTFALPNSKGNEEERAMGEEMRAFVGNVLQFVGQQKAHLPPVGGAEIRCYPFRIAARAVA